MDMKENLNNNARKQQTSRLAVAALSALILAALWLAYLLVNYGIWRFLECTSLSIHIFQKPPSMNDGLRIITHIIIILGPVFGLIASRQIRLSNSRLSGKRLAVAAIWIGFSLVILCNLITIAVIMGLTLLHGLGPG
jgi:hypothetical protein